MTRLQVAQESRRAHQDSAIALVLIASSVDFFCNCPQHTASLAKTFCAILSLKRIIIVNTIKIRSPKFNPILLFKIQIAQREEKSLYFCNRV